MGAQERGQVEVESENVPVERQKAVVQVVPEPVGGKADRARGAK